MSNFFEQRRVELSMPNGKPMTQRFIADQLGMTSAAVGSWERGESAPRLHLVPRLAQIYRVSEKRIQDAIFELSTQAIKEQSAA